MITKKRVLYLSFLFLLFFFSMNAYAQSVTVTGNVRSAAGDGLYGVSVMEVGTKHTTITNKEGGFAIQVASASKLSFSFAGYKTSVVAIQEQMNIHLVLEEEESEIDEAIIAYGSQPKAMVTGSMATIYGDELREVPASNITQALQGRIAGLQLSQTSTKPGTSMQMRIRGTHSVDYTNDPLIMLDGAPFAGSITDISIDDIKRIDVLKDITMTGMYGSRGSNGVILITTNKGVKGQKMQLTYNGYYGLKSAIEYPMMNAAEFIKLRATAGRFGYGMDESDQTDTDWQGLLYRTGLVSNHDIGLSGGTKKGNYKFHVGYYNDKAVVPGLDYSRFSLRGAFEQEIGSYLRFGFSTNSNFNVNNGEGFEVFNVLTMTPIADPFVRDAGGNVVSTKRVINLPADNMPVVTRDIINNLGDQWIDQTQGYGSYNSLYGEIKIPGIKGLKYTMNFGLNHRNSTTEKYTGVGVLRVSDDYPAQTKHGESKLFQNTMEHLLSYDRVFSQKHRLNATLLSSVGRTKYSRKNYKYSNEALSSADSVFTTSGYRSLVGRVMYSFDDRYMISATVRSDASLGLIPITNSQQTSPSVAMGWDIRKASFMKHTSSIDALKLRVEYGKGALTLGSETVITKNAGLDFSVFKGRLSGAAEFYIINSKEFRWILSLPGGPDLSVRQIDGASIQNKGMELTLKAIVLNNLNGWSWNVGVNLYTNKSKVVALPMGEATDPERRLFMGHSLNVIYEYKRIGLWNKTDADYQYLSVLEPQGNVGMIKVEYTGAYDETGKPVRAIGYQDRQIIDCDPDFMGGINSHLAYKGFDLVITGVFQSGGILNSTLYGRDSYLNMNSGRRGQIKIDYWTPDHTNAKYPAPGGVANGDFPKYGNTTGYFNASYLKINTITVGYNVRSELLKTAGFEKLRLYGTLQNPFVLFSPYYNETGMDPQTNSYAGDGPANAMPPTPGRFLIVAANTPSTKNFIIGVNVAF